MATATDPSSTVHDGTAPAGALTAVFTPPLKCVEDSDLYYKTASCMPSPERWDLYWGAASFYSPGICPSGMVSAAVPPPFFGPPVEPGETAIVCCPSKYTLSASSDTHSCQGIITTTAYSFADGTVTVTTDSSTAIETTVTRAYYTFTTDDNIYPIQVRWRESDLAALETHPLSPGVTPTSTGDGAGGEGKDGQNDGGGGLSDGAIAGIAVGAVAVVAVLGLAIYLLCCRRRRRQATRPASSDVAFPNSTAQWRSPSMSASDNPPIGAEFVAVGDESVDAELQRITARRARLQELERLDEEEAQLRMPFRSSPAMAELSSGSISNVPVEMGPRRA